MFSGNQQGERRPLMEQGLGPIIAELESFLVSVYKCTHG
jgi:hypothetical protein